MRAEAQRSALLLACSLLLALALRLPLLSLHTRYFFHEDDAHHFNRTVEMAQSLDPNPHYFNKPALHFYLRAPVVWASAAWGRAMGDMGSIQEIETRDPFGLSGYAFTASHPRVLAWSRGFSVLLSLCVVALTFVAARLAGASPLGSALASLLVSVSPESVINSDIIGVDVPMALFCLLSTVVGMWCVRGGYSRRKLLACGILAGLAGATKYNAAPVALVPLVVALCRDRSFKGLAIAVAAPVLGYAAGAPYSLISFGEFWQGLSYEVWHYRVSGHEGHSASPGIEQALFYLSWLAQDGVGVAATALAVLGLLACAARRGATIAVFASFPLAYLALMVAQRANFTRNMVCFVPYAAVAAALGLELLARRVRLPHLRTAISFSVALVALLIPAARSASIVAAEARHQESRDVLAAWLESGESSDETAIAGTLLPSAELLRHPGIMRFDGEPSSIPGLVQEGVARFAIPSGSVSGVTIPFAVDLAIPGEAFDRHAPRNPPITVLRATDATREAARHIAPAQLLLALRQDGAAEPRCLAQEERHCWLQHRTTRLMIPAGATRVELEVMSPWPGQEVHIALPSGESLRTISNPPTGTWLPVSVTLASPGPTVLVAETKKIHSPKDRGLNADPRRLGVAIRERMPS